MTQPDTLREALERCNGNLDAIEEAARLRDYAAIDVFIERQRTTIETALSTPTTAPEPVKPEWMQESKRAAKAKVKTLREAIGRRAGNEPPEAAPPEDAELERRENICIDVIGDAVPDDTPRSQMKHIHRVASKAVDAAITAERARYDRLVEAANTFGDEIAFVINNYPIEHIGAMSRLRRVLGTFREALSNPTQEGEV